MTYCSNCDYATQCSHHSHGAQNDPGVESPKPPPNRNIEDTVFDTHLPVNTYAMLQRGVEIMDQAKKHSFSSFNSTEQHQYKKLLWLLCDQVYGGIAHIDFMEEWRALKEKEVELNANKFDCFSVPDSGKSIEKETANIDFQDADLDSEEFDDSDNSDGNLKDAFAIG